MKNKSVKRPPSHKIASPLEDVALINAIREGITGRSVNETKFYKKLRGK